MCIEMDVNAFCFISGMNANNDLGIYLGAPIIHGRIKKNHFKFIVEKVQKQLAGQKTKTLTFVGRTTLVQTMSSTIPNYNMNTTVLPQSICNEINKINRNFLRGDTDGKKKVYLVKWEKVCKPKKYGGLGIRAYGMNNLHTVAKLGWSLISDKDNLWAKVMRDKYKIPRNPRDWKIRKNSSYLERCVKNQKVPP